MTPTRHPAPRPLRLTGDGRSVEWVSSGALSGSHYDRLATGARGEASQKKVPIDRRPLDSLLSDSGETRPPDLLIFHTSRCGSTLLTELLVRLEESVVIAESGLVSELLRPAPEVDAVVRGEYLRGFLHRHGEWARPGRFIVKLDCDHILRFPFLRTLFPQARVLFLFRDPVEVLVSQARAPGLPMLPEPGALERWPHFGERPAAEFVLDHTARRLGGMLRAALEHGLPLLTYPEIRTENLPGLMEHCGVRASVAELRRLAGIFEHSAKHPMERFCPDGETKRREASTAVRRLAEEHCLESYRQLLNRRQAQGIEGDAVEAVLPNVTTPSNARIISPPPIPRRMMPSSSAFQSPLVQQIARFLGEIGIAMEPADITRKTFLPGILVKGSTLHVDESRLKYPGDLLHEAGHIAVAPPSRRNGLLNNVSNDPTEELMAIAWSWAALKHLDLDPEVVFHPHGYKDGAAAIVEAFSAGGGFGTPMLQWLGMTAQGTAAEALGVPPFPHMMEWIRIREVADLSVEVEPVSDQSA